MYTCYRLWKCAIINIQPKTDIYIYSQILIEKLGHTAAEWMVILTLHIAITFLPPVNCSDPTPPTDGSIDPYHNTTEGAEISFRCDPGFVPTESTTAVCGEDQRWTPDPADHRCTCEY